MAKTTINAADLTFGIEIECYLPYEAAAEIGSLSYRYPSQVPGLPRGWKAKTDGSLVSPPAGKTGVEIVSPVLKGAEGLRQVIEVCRWLNANDASVNWTCGLHVHVGFDRSEPVTLGRLVALVARHEKALYAATGTRRREASCYAKPIRQARAYVSKFRDKNRHAVVDDRYFSLNLTSAKPTVEFRLFSGTTNATKIIAYVRLALGLVQKALESARDASWEMQTTSRRRKGEGANALAWMFLELGWMSPKHRKAGLFEVEGGPDLKATKAELVRLAAKYDGGAQD